MTMGARATWCLLMCVIGATGVAACAARSRLPFAGDGTPLDFGPKESIVKYQLVLAMLSTAGAAQHRFTFSGIPSNRYSLALVINGVDLDKCMAIFHADDKGINVDFGVQDDDSGIVIVPSMAMSGWRVSFSPSPKSYDTGPPSRRCVLYPDNNPHFQLDNAHKYTVEVTIRRMQLASSLPISIVLEGKGGSGEL